MEVENCRDTTGTETIISQHIQKCRNGQTEPRIKQNSLSDVAVCFVDVDDWHKVDSVAMRGNSRRVAAHHVLQILLDVIKLQVQQTTQ